MTAAPNRLVIVAPNWLGDAVMALPLIADIRRQWTGAHLTVAGRGSVAAMFELVDDVDDVIRLHGAGGIGAVMSAEKNAAIRRCCCRIRSSLRGLPIARASLSAGAFVQMAGRRC